MCVDQDAAMSDISELFEALDDEARWTEGYQELYDYLDHIDCQWHAQYVR